MDDFGDILDRWDRSSKDRKEGKTKPAPGPMDDWLDRYPPGDSDLADPQEDDRDRGAASAHLRELEPQAELDLHGMRADQASSAMTNFLAGSRKRGLRKVLLIHGKGHHSKEEPVLKKLVQDHLERSPHAGAFGAADRKIGGSGATWVILRA